MASDAPNQQAAPTSAPAANEPSGPIGRLSHDHLDVDAEERRHRRDKRGNQPVMAIILGLIVLTAIVFYGFHLRAVAREEAAAKQRAAAQAAEAAASAPSAATPAPTTAPTAAVPAPGAAPPASPTAAKPAADTKPAAAKPADTKPADTKPAGEPKAAPVKADKPARPAKKTDEKTKNLPRLPILPEG
jgi:outer membrane biosynthesis protein TonB